MYSKTSAFANSRVLYTLFRILSFFKLLKNDSATALSQQFPLRLMLASRLWALQKRIQSSLPYWEPWSEWMMTLCRGLRRQTAISSASRPVSRLITAQVRSLLAATRRVAADFVTHLARKAGTQGAGGGLGDQLSDLMSGCHRKVLRG